MKRLNAYLDNAVRAILEDDETQLSADAINALHGATSTHPWAEGRPIHKRALSAYYAVTGRRVRPDLYRDLRRVALGLPRKITNVAGTTYRVGDRVRAIGDGWEGTITAIDAFGSCALLLVDPDDVEQVPGHLRSPAIFPRGSRPAVATFCVPRDQGLSMGNFEKIGAAQ